MFTLINTGSINGWAKLTTFENCETKYNTGGENKFGFCKFLSVIEITIYYICFALGAYCMNRVQYDLAVTLDPFEESESQ
jgi:hypothetical protein